MPTIYDATLRQQVFLEGLKSQQHNEMQKTAIQIVGLFIDELRSLALETLDDLTKSEFRAMLSRVKSKAVVLYGKYSAAFVKFLEQFTAVEAGMTALIIKELGEDLSRNVPLRDFGKKYAAKVWARISNSTLSATGDNFLKYIDSFGVVTLLTIEKTIKMAQANSDTVSVLIERLGPTKQGVLSKILANGRSMVSTAIQHVSGQVAVAVQSTFYNEYDWISVIDNSTSLICRERNKQRYKYGEGPIPPAHPHCRSRAVPVTADAEKPKSSFAKWLTGQSEQIKQYGLSENSQPLSLEQYRNKTGLIVL